MKCYVFFSSNIIIFQIALIVKGDGEAKFSTYPTGFTDIKNQKAKLSTYPTGFTDIKNQKAKLSRYPTGFTDIKNQKAKLSTYPTGFTDIKNQKAKLSTYPTGFTDIQNQKNDPTAGAETNQLTAGENDIELKDLPPSFNYEDIKKINIGNKTVVSGEKIGEFIGCIFNLTKDDITRHIINTGPEGEGVDKLKKIVKPKLIAPRFAAMWPMGIIPYMVDSASYDDVLEKRLRGAMKLIEANSCLKFQRLNNKAEGNGSWLYIANPTQIKECIHDTAKHSGPILLVLGLDCLNTRDILHSLFHGLGFYDEITHPNRGSFVRIQWENIQPEYRHLFVVQPSQNPIDYDPLSVMNFHDRAFSTNGHATIEPLIPGLILKPSRGLSQLDTLKLHVTFGQECNRRKVVNLVGTCGRVLKGDNAVTDDSGGDQGNQDNQNQVTDDSKQSLDHAKKIDKLFDEEVNLPTCPKSEIPNIVSHECIKVSKQRYDLYQSFLNGACTGGRRTKQSCCINGSCCFIGRNLLP